MQPSRRPELDARLRGHDQQVFKRFQAALIFLLLAFSSSAHADRAGAFDYYLMSLSWSPEYCASQGRPDEMQCQRPYAFVVHGLWPQNERGWPQNCGRPSFVPQSLIEKMLPIMPSKPLILHEWKKHGVCSGLSAENYFGLVESAYRSIRVPARYQRINNYLSTDRQALKAAFIADNPALSSQAMSLQCSGPYLAELRICLDKNSLKPRACGADQRDRCREKLVLRPLR